MPTPRIISAALALAVFTGACSPSQSPAEPQAVPLATPSEGQTAAPPKDMPSPPAVVSTGAAGICNIEMIGSVSDLSESTVVQVGPSTSVSGWRTFAAADGSEAHAWLRVLAGDGSVVFLTPLPASEDRPDVEAAIGRASALRSGFRDIAVSGLPHGSFTLEVVLDAGSEWVRCMHTRKIEVH